MMCATYFLFYPHERVFGGLDSPRSTHFIICLHSFALAFTKFICSHVWVFSCYLRRFVVLVYSIYMPEEWRLLYYTLWCWMTTTKTTCWMVVVRVWWDTKWYEQQQQQQLLFVCIAWASLYVYDRQGFLFTFYDSWCSLRWGPVQAVSVNLFEQQTQQRCTKWAVLLQRANIFMKHKFWHFE